MSKLAKQYLAEALAGNPPESILIRYEIYLSCWSDDSTLKTFNAWLNS